MTALRQEAIDIVNNVPDDLLASLVQYLRTFKDEKIDSRNRGATADGIDPKKAAAFAALEEWRVRNRKYSKLVVDWEKEFLEAIDEKYGTSH